ncbi:hypothetical protein K0U83_11970 [bacterium]|nr:hypothetical protein [bacterium]
MPTLLDAVLLPWSNPTMQKNTALIIRRDGADLTLNDGRAGRIPCGTETTAQALLDFMVGRPARGSESIRSWVSRCVADYEAAVWARIERGSR